MNLPGLGVAFHPQFAPVVAGIVTSGIWIPLTRSSTLRELKPVAAFLLYCSRVQESFTGCRVASYCLMDNHFHLLLEVPPMAVGGLSDAELLKRLAAIYNEALVAEVAEDWRRRGSR